MARLGPLPFRKIDKALRLLEFEAIRQRGSHVIYKHPDGRVTVVPNHPGEDVGPGLVRKILRDIGIDREDFLRLV